MREIVAELDADRREGIVIKADDPAAHRTKYVLGLGSEVVRETQVALVALALPVCPAAGQGLL